MKRTVLLLALSILLCISGCSSEDTTNASGTEFYYLRSDIIYGAEDGVITSELYQGQVNSLAVLLEAYLRGPSTEGLLSPFPRGTYIMFSQLKGSTLTLRLSNHVSTLSPFDQTLAYACLAKTCFAYSDITEIRLQADDSDALTVLTPESLILNDSTDTIHATIGTEPLSP